MNTQKRLVLALLLSTSLTMFADPLPEQTETAGQSADGRQLGSGDVQSQEQTDDAQQLEDGAPKNKDNKTSEKVPFTLPDGWTLNKVFPDNPLTSALNGTGLQEARNWQYHCAAVEIVEEMLVTGCSSQQAFNNRNGSDQLDKELVQRSAVHLAGKYVQGLYDIMKNADNDADKQTAQYVLQHRALDLEKQLENEYAFGTPIQNLRRQIVNNKYLVGAAAVVGSMATSAVVWLLKR